MVLVDTSVWIDHIRNNDPRLFKLLEKNEVLYHPFVYGKVAMGSLADRQSILRDIKKLPDAKVARHDEVMSLVEGSSLFGLGIGYIDAHLLVSTQLMPGARIWTRDKRLLEIADRFSLSFTPSLN